jgi:ESF2/ABP1 family protein
MPPYKRNQFLDAEDSNDEESQGYNSEEQELQKGGHNAKNRNNGEAQTSQEDDQPRNEGRQTQGSELDDEGKAQEETDRNEKKVKDYQKPPELLKSLNKKNLVATEMAIRKSGVVYLSRIPPFMKLVKLRSLLEPYGTINRIFLAPEDPVAHARRVRNGGNKRKLHTEGWVEFVNKRDAKKACELLNGRAIGGKKGSYYCDDIWNLVYLKGFKWHNLTEYVISCLNSSLTYSAV